MSVRFLYPTTAAKAYADYLASDSKPVLHPLVWNEEYKGWFVNGVWCFTSLCYEDPKEDGLYFFEDTDGLTPARYDSSVDMAVVREAAAFWIWYQAANWSIAFTKADGTKVYSWYTKVYPEFRT